MLPEEKIARRVLKDHGLTPPYDLAQLVRNYATLQFKSIPITGVDGLSVNIKVIGKKPIIIINSDIPETRQLFTLAHELGHLRIPWHCGIDFEEIISSQNAGYAEYKYQEMEQEANRFAAELLMPEAFIKDLFKKKQTLSNLHQEICSLIGVSEQAAAIRLSQVLPKNIMFIAYTSSEHHYSGITPGSFIKKLDPIPFSPNLIYPEAEEYSSFDAKGSTFHWWKVGERKISSIKSDDRTWREILDDILEWDPDSERFKRSLSGKIGSVNSKLQREGTSDTDKLYSACYNRLLHDEDMRPLTKHKDFELFLSKRVVELIINAKK